MEEQKSRQIIIALGVALALAMGSCGYLYSQLAAFKAQEVEFKEYQVHKKEQNAKLQQLLNDNEKMLRDMSEISNLEKKLRRAIMRDVDSSKLGFDNKDVNTQTPVPNYAGGQGGGKDMDTQATLAVLAAQNSNIKGMIADTKKSVSDLLGQVEGRSGAAARFPDKWPTEGGVISSAYGARTGPIEGGYEWHAGIDIAVEMGTPVYASGAGRIVKAGYNGGYGQYVKIDHQNGYETAYGHMSALAVAAGQDVAKGEIIGFAGSTGYSTGPHVHFEVTADGQAVDPYFMVKK